MKLIHVSTFAAAEEYSIQCKLAGREISVMYQSVCTMLPTSDFITTFRITCHLCIYLQYVIIDTCHASV